MSICPYPQCEYNEYPRCGAHFCILPVCLYPAACYKAITDEINRIIVLGELEKQADRLAALKAERKRLEEIT